MAAQSPQLPPDDQAFARLVVQQGLASKRQVQEGLELVKQLLAAGKPAPLAHILVQKGYVTSQQVELLRKRPSSPMGGIKIPGYELLSKLGQGGMGAVFKARQLSMDRAVAMKILFRRLARDSSYVDRFLREARAVAQLNHENIIRGIDVGEHEGNYYFVMEFVDGTTVQKLLRRDGKIEERRALEIARQVSRALQHAMENRLVHRDVKPENIMITADGTAKLCDLGLAKELTQDSSLTQAGTSVGTPHYISPEQARGERDVDIRADIYSLGASLYHMLTGRTAFLGSNPTVVMTKHVTEDIIPPRNLESAISEGANQLILKMMSKRRAERYQKPSEIVEELDRILAGERPLAAEEARRARRESRALEAARMHRDVSSRLEPRRSPAALLAVLGLLLIGGGLLAWWGLSGDSEETTTTTADSSSERVAEETPPRDEDDGDTTEPGSAPETDPAGGTAPAPQESEELEALRELLDLYRETPAKYEMLLGRLDEFIESARSAELIRQVNREKTTLLKKIDAEANSLLEDLKRDAEKLLGEDRVFDAAMVYERFPDTHRLPGVKAAGQARRLHDELLDGLGQRFEKDERKLASLRKAHRFEDARALCDRVLRYGSPEMREETGNWKRELEEARRVFLVELRRQAEQSYEAWCDELDELLAARQYDRAASLCDEALQDEALGLLGDRICEHQKDVQLLAELIDDLNRGIDALIESGRTIELSMAKGFPGVLKRRDTKIILQFKEFGGFTDVTLEKLHPPDVVLLACATLDEKDPTTHLKLGLFLFFAKRYDAAEASLTRALEGGAERARTYLTRIEEAQYTPEELEGLGVLKALREAVERQQWERAEDCLKALERNYAQLPALAERAEELAQLKARVARARQEAATDRIKDMFRVPVQRTDDGRIRLRYDFSEPEQLEDWRAQRGRWSIDDERGHLVGNKDGELLWKGSLLNDVILEFELTARTGENLGAFLCSDHRSRSYQFRLGLELPPQMRFLEFAPNAIFFLDSEKLREIGIANLARISEAFHQIAGFEKPKLVPNKSYRLRLEREQDTLRFFVNGNLRAEGLDDQLHAGTVGLHVAREGMIVDNLTITGILDPDWAEAQAREPRDGGEDDR